MGEAHLFTGHCPVQRPEAASSATVPRAVTSTPARPGPLVYFVHSVLILVSPLIPLPCPPSVRVPSSSWDSIRQIFLLHFPQPRHPSLALGGWLHLPAHCEPHCGPGLGLLNTPWSQPQTQAMGWPNTGFQGAGVWEAVAWEGGSRVVSLGSGCFHSRWDRSSPPGLQH